MKKEAIIKFYQDFRMSIFPVVVALSSLFLIIFALYPQITKLINGQKAADTLFTKSKILETKVLALESFNEEDLSQKVGFALSSLPTEKDFGNIFSLLQQIIVSSGFNIVSITLGNSAGRVGNSDSYEVKLELRGGRSLFPTLLRNLESSPRLIRINTISVSSNQASGVMEVSLVVQVLYAKFTQSIVAADAPLPQISQQDEDLIAKISKEGSISIPGSARLLPRGKANPFE